MKTPRERLDNFMMYKHIKLSDAEIKGFYDPNVISAMGHWKIEEVEEILDQLIETIRKGTYSDADICPHCIKYYNCGDCEWGKWMGGCCEPSSWYYKNFPKGKSMHHYLDSEEMLTVLNGND